MVILIRLGTEIPVQWLQQQRNRGGLSTWDRLSMFLGLLLPTESKSVSMACPQTAMYVGQKFAQRRDDSSDVGTTMGPPTLLSGAIRLQRFIILRACNNHYTNVLLFTHICHLWYNVQGIPNVVSYERYCNITTFHPFAVKVRHCPVGNVENILRISFGSPCIHG